MNLKEKYSAIILARDSGSDLIKAVKSLLAQTITPESILIYIRRSPLTNDNTVRNNLEKSGIDLKTSNIILELNEATESGWDYNVTPPFEAFSSMSRMRNKCLNLMAGDNILWIDSDIQIKSTDGVEKLINASLMKRDDKNLLFAAPVKKSIWKFESTIKEINPVSGMECHRMHISQTGPIRYSSYTDSGLCQSIRDMAEFMSVDVSGSLVYMTHNWIKNHKDPFQCNIFGEWHGLCDKNSSKTIIVRDVVTIHRSMLSHG